LTNTKQSGDDEDYLQKVDDDACPHKAKEIKHKPLDNGNLPTYIIYQIYLYTSLIQPSKQEAITTYILCKSQYIQNTESGFP